MADDKSKTGKQDKNRINLDEEYEVNYWADKFGISKKELAKVVSEVGNNAKDVKNTLKKAQTR